VLNSGGDGLPPGVGETAPGRDSQACQSSGTALRCQSIKCSYARAGTCACGSARGARVGALERSGPHPRGCSALERGGRRSRGAVEPSSEADPARGGVGASGEADPARGSVYPSSEADLTRGRPLCCHGGPRGPPGSWLCCVCALGVRVDLCFAFLQVLSGFPLVISGTLMVVPDSSPQASVGVPVRFPQMLEPADRMSFPPGC
jgi:hypothetical protein